MILQIKESLLPQCLDVIHRSFATVAAEYNLTKENCPTNGAFIPLSRLERDFNKGCPMFGCFLHDEIVGFMELCKVDDDTCELEKLAVLPSHRHCGCGKSLLDFARETASEAGFKQISIGIIEENARLKAWYAANGFIHSGTKEFSHLPFTVGYMYMPIRRG